MMKSFIVFALALCLCHTGFAQSNDGSDDDRPVFKLPVDSITGKITYSAIVDVKGNRDTLYARASAWVTEQFTSKDDVINLDDKDAIITVRSSLPMRLSDVPTGNHTTFILIISIKDGKYRYAVNSFKWVAANSLDFDSPSTIWTQVLPKDYDTLKHLLDQKVKALIVQLKKSMARTDW